MPRHAASGEFCRIRASGEAGQDAGSRPPIPATHRCWLEGGFPQFASGSYKSNVNTVTIRAMRFAETSGAFAAYTFYRVPGMAPEDIGKGASRQPRALLEWRNGGGCEVRSPDGDVCRGIRDLAAKVPMVGHLPVYRRRCPASCRAPIWKPTTPATRSARRPTRAAVGCSSGDSSISARALSCERRFQSAERRRHPYHHRVPHAPDCR